MTFVAIVGADGAGKTTVSLRVVEALIASGQRARYLDRWDVVGNQAYPSASFIQHDIPHIRACVADMPMPARLLFLLWTMSLALSGDQRDHEDSEILVMDAYWMKHAASEAVYGLPTDWVLTVASLLPPPDIVIHLRLAPERAWSRKQPQVVPYECGMDASCSQASFLRHQGRIAQLLDEWSERFAWTRVDASVPLTSVVEATTAHILAGLHREARDT